MFTVVIAEKVHIDSIQQFHTYLAPILKQSETHVCLWKPEELTLDDAVPELQTVVGRQEVWRAIVIGEESTIHQKNPFDVVPFSADKAPLYVRDGAWYQAYFQQKIAAFETAATKPLVRLMTWLCEPPLTTAGINHAEQEDPAFAEYLAETEKKEEIRKNLCESLSLCINRPSEVLCVAQRTCIQQEYDIRTAWKEHEELHYSRFYDWNLYFDKMRYLVFDILPKDHNSYPHDYLRFLYAILTLAGQEIPKDCLRPNRVYALDCEDDKQTLRQMLFFYDNKLEGTAEMLARKLEQMQKEKKRHLTDQQANTIFCAKVNVPVTISSEVDQSGLLADKQAYGLATDCPQEEYGTWEIQLSTARKTVDKLLKQPRRSLRKAVGTLRGMNAADTDQALLLNDFQREDVADYIHEEERKMVSVPTPMLYDTAELDRDMDALDREIKDKIETRMRKKTTVFLGTVAIMLFALGFLPLLLFNRENAGQFLFSLSFSGVAVAMILLVGIVCLFCLRASLRRLVAKFNDRMRVFRLSLDQAMLSFSAYLSHTCNVMRGFSVLNYCEEYGDTDTRKELILKKHIQDLQRCRSEIRELFGEYIPLMDARQPDPEEGDVYLFDYNRPVDYEYELPMQEQYAGEIEFLQKGNYIQVPIRYLRCLRLHREEFYDEKEETE